MTPKILLVEDDPDRITLTLHALDREGFEADVDVATDGVEAVEHLFDDEASDLPDLVLLDLKLPRLDGFEVLERIRDTERTRHIPVVVLTSSSEASDRIESYQLGANSYVAKPVDFTAFSEAIARIGRYWLSVNDSPLSTPEPSNER